MYMSAGSSNSNLGYGYLNPYVTKSSAVNATSENNPAFFTSKQIPSHGLVGAASNINAAKGMIGGFNKYKKNNTNNHFNGRKKNVSKIYNNMKKFSIRNIGSKLSRGFKTMFKRSKNNKYNNKSKSRSNKSFKNKSFRRRNYNYKGGYAQFQNNYPNTPSYSVGGVPLGASSSALANPPPYSLIAGNCKDNYNHFTGKGFASKGH